MKFAHEERAYLQQTVRDFTCRVTKRERIDGELQDYYYIDMRVREQTYAGGRMTQPFSVMLRFLGPSDVEGRRALFVAGQNDNKLLVGIPRVVYGRSPPPSARRSAHGRCPLRVSRAAPPPASCQPRAGTPLRASAPREDTAPQDRVGAS
ncbi:MAG: DUF1571 domain-containing protein [Planctomycetia bacterium]|nr:DUF1571 domain-containing protein [Planctomycetia bacterium]